jgi:hypothetical protein
MPAGPPGKRCRIYCSSFRGVSEASEPGIQTRAMALDSGFVLRTPRNDDGPLPARL